VAEVAAIPAVCGAGATSVGFLPLIRRAAAVVGGVGVVATERLDLRRDRGPEVEPSATSSSSATRMGSFADRLAEVSAWIFSITR